MMFVLLLQKVQLQQLVNGECSAIAKSKDGGLQAICRVAVKESRPLTAITLDIHSLQLEKGEQRQLKAILTPENPDDGNIIWSTSNDNIEVSNTGIVKAKNEGKVWVYAKSTDGAIGDSCKVEVITHVKGLHIEPASLTFKKLGDSFSYVLFLTQPMQLTLQLHGLVLQLMFVMYVKMVLS